jgi:hypothetical protein
MVAFPSKIEFTSFLQYAPRGSSTISAASRDIAYKVKQVGHVRQVRIIDHAAKRLFEEIPNYPFLGDCFNESLTLVPAPRSAPLLRNALWVPRRICESIKAFGLATSILPCLERTQPVRKSATAAPRQRPGPEDHYNSVKVNAPSLISNPKAITLVDDVITRGST